MFDKGTNENGQNTYIYDKENRILTPEKYQFSGYVGSDFLDAYQRSRLLAIRTVIAKMKITLPEDLSFIYIGDDENFNVSVTNTIFHIDTVYTITEKYCEDFTRGTSYDLITCWGKVVKSCNEHDGILVQKIFNYIKKYEVTKKIYDNYGVISSSEDDVNDYTNPANYMLLSNLLCDYHLVLKNKHEELILINTILKLNDLIISIADTLLKPVDLLLAYSCLLKEKNIYTKMLQEVE